MQTIDDVVSTGYSNIEMPSTGSAPAPKGESSQGNNPAPESKKTPGEKTPKDSGSLEKPQDDDVDDLAGDESEDDDSEAGEGQQGQDKNQAPGKRSKGIERRIKKLTKAQAELRAEAQYWREQALKANQPQPQSQQDARVETKAQPQDGKPKPDDFETIAEYTDALVDWKEAQREKAQEANAQAQTLQSKLQKHEDRVKSFKEQAPDFDLAVQEFATYHPNVRINQALADLVLDSELSAPLAYDLFKNPDVLIRLNSMPPAQAAREIGKMESRIERTIEEKKAQSKIQTKSNAPTPLSPIGSSNAGASAQKSIYEMTPDEYMEYRRKKK